MSTAQWIGIVFTVVSLAVGYGALKSTVASLREEIVLLRQSIKELQGSSERQGERIGKLETGVALANQELSRPYRVAPPKKEGDKDG